jgi:hypothetical protein
VRCGLVTDASWVSPDFTLGRRFDFSYTYDLAPIASRRFRDCVSDWNGAVFHPLPREADHFLIEVEPVVACNASSPQMIYEEPCSTCGRYTQVAGVVDLASDAVLPRGFSRTDVLFGSSRGDPRRPTSQRPVLLVDIELADQLRRCDLTGLILRPLMSAAT